MADGVVEEAGINAERVGDPTEIPPRAAALPGTMAAGAPGAGAPGFARLPRWSAQLLSRTRSDTAWI